ncbi:MAG: hypothetical protein PHZ06_12260 [Proteiniphilum sp.]|nr:hypothetical protein [Proteiniphilum sp.]
MNLIVSERLMLDGPVFPLAQKNRNGWGVPLDSVDSAISTLKTSVVRICPSIFGESEHHCDLSGSRKDEIGKIVDAYLDNNEVRAVVEITDSAAIQKLSDGTWQPTWSVFGGGQRDSDGWVHGYTNESLTFVKNPAWESAKGEIIFSASEDEQLEVKNLKSYITLGLNQDKEDLSKYYASILNSDDFLTDNPSSTIIDNIKGETMTDTVESTPTEGVDFDKVVASKDEEIAKLKEQIKTMEKVQAAAISPDTFETVVASRIDVALKAERERIEKDLALTDYKNVCASLEITPDAERFNDEKFSASDVRMHIDLLNKVAGKRENVEAGAPLYSNTPEQKGETPESFQNESGWTVGYFRDGQWFTE